MKKVQQSGQEVVVAVAATDAFFDQLQQQKKKRTSNKLNPKNEKQCKPIENAYEFLVNE